MQPADIRTLIQDGLSASGFEHSKVEVLSEDNTHYVALVVSEAFAGKRPLARHQIIYQCLGSLMGNEIHAMSIRAHTPEEWRAQSDARQV